MNKDMYMTQLRNLLVVLSGLLVGVGIGTTEEVQQVSEGIVQVVAAVGTLIYVGTTVWQWIVRFRTRAVPEEVGARRDVPTVSPVTGKKEA